MSSLIQYGQYANLRLRVWQVSRVKASLQKVNCHTLPSLIKVSRV